MTFQARQRGRHLQGYAGLWPGNDQRILAIHDLDLSEPAVGAVRDISRTG